MIINSNSPIFLPEWIMSLEEEDINFIKQFVLLSGSLKDLAKHYGVSYPTVRLRLDRIIIKIINFDSNEVSSMESVIKYLAIDGKIDVETAKLLLNTYRKEK